MWRRRPRSVVVHDDPDGFGEQRLHVSAFLSRRLHRLGPTELCVCLLPTLPAAQASGSGGWRQWRRRGGWYLTWICTGFTRDAIVLQYRACASLPAANVHVSIGCDLFTDLSCRSICVLIPIPISLFFLFVLCAG